MANNFSFMDGMDELDIPEDVPELDAVDEGEYTIEVIGLRAMRAGEDDWPALMPRFKVVDHPNTKTFNHFMYLPNKEMDDERKARAARNLKSFCEAVGIEWPPNPQTDFDEEALMGIQLEASLGIEEDEEFGRQNRIKRFTKKA